jgi:hypothetical protein
VEKFAPSEDSGDKYAYTVISFLGANLPNNTGATQEAKEYIEKLAPQIKDRSLAITVLGFFRQEDGLRSVRRYDIDCTGVRDTTDGLAQTLAGGEGKKAGVHDLFQKETLQSFIEYSMNKFPAKHYVFSQFSHGDNINGLGCDPSDPLASKGGEGKYGSINLAGLKETFEGAREKTGRKMDVIDFDSCFMGNYEVLSALRNEADYIVASPAEQFGIEALDNVKTAHGPKVPRSGHQQVEVFEKILQNPSIEPRALAEEFVKTGAAEGRVEETFGADHSRKTIFDATPTLYSYSTRESARLDGFLDRLGQDIQARIDPRNDKDNSGINILLNTIAGCRNFDSSGERPYVDLKEFSSKIIDSLFPGDTERKNEMESAFQDLSVAQFRGHKSMWESKPAADLTQSGPVGVFLPGSIKDKFTTTMTHMAHVTLEKLGMPLQPPQLIESTREKARYATPDKPYKAPTHDDALSLWTDALANRDKIGLTEEEAAEAGKFRDITSRLVEGNRSGADVAPLKQEYEGMLRNKDYNKAGLKKIVEYDIDRKTGLFLNYEKLGDVPPGWKSLVTGIKDRLIDFMLGNVEEVLR